jgi:hypothetical protein
MNERKKGGVVMGITFPGIPDSTILLFLVAILFLVFWFVALIEVLKSEFVNPNDKIVWTLVLLLVAPVGVLLYIFIGTKQKK